MHKINFRIISFLCVLLTSCCSTSSALAGEMVAVKGDTINLRSGPGLQHGVIWEYGSGFPLEVVKKQGDWLQVKDFEDETGWIHKSHVNKGTQAIVKANKGQEQTINIRSGPGSETAITGNAYYGVVFSVLEVKAEWVKVQHDSGFSGWVNKSFLWGL